MIESEDYIRLHSQPLQPLDLKVDVTEFHNYMNEVKYAFRAWGEKNSHYLRYGLPLVNKNGSSYNNPEPTCYPLDEWARKFPESEQSEWVDRKFTEHTEFLNHKCFNSINAIKHCMVRSCILRWDEPSSFYPHTDTWLPSPIIRLWGTTTPDTVKIRFDTKLQRANPWEVNSLNEIDVQDFVDFEVEPGRLYILDTNIVHSARSLTHESTYQFFIALHSDSYKLIDDLKLVI